MYVCLWDLFLDLGALCIAFDFFFLVFCFFFCG